VVDFDGIGHMPSLLPESRIEAFERTPIGVASTSRRFLGGAERRR